MLSRSHSHSIIAFVSCRAAYSTIERECRPATGLSASANSWERRCPHRRVPAGSGDPNNTVRRPYRPSPRKYQNEAKCGGVTPGLTVGDTDSHRGFGRMPLQQFALVVGNAWASLYSGDDSRNDCFRHVIVMAFELLVDLGDQFCLALFPHLETVNRGGNAQF